MGVQLSEKSCIAFRWHAAPGTAVSSHSLAPDPTEASSGWGGGGGGAAPLGTSRSGFLASGEMLFSLTHDTHEKQLGNFTYDHRLVVTCLLAPLVSPQIFRGASRVGQGN